MKAISTDKIRYTVCDCEIDYEPKNYISTLDWFNIAKCARARMTANAHKINEWRGERRTFYTALQRMDVDNVGLMD